MDPEDRNFEVWQTRVDQDRNRIKQKLGGDLTAVEALTYGAFTLDGFATLVSLFSTAVIRLSTFNLIAVSFFRTAVNSFFMVIL